MKNLKKYTYEDDLLGNITLIFSNETGLIEEIIVSSNNDSNQIAIDRYGNLEEEKPERFLKKLQDYLKGNLFKFSLDDLNMDKFSDFHKSVLIEEFNSEYGSTNSYSELASKINNPKASRAVGTALGKNPYPIVIPCHRTLKRDGSIGNYTGGVEIKKKLLDLEKNNKK
ncbi:methylated-DNA--[protein]-cysteine S-methyltransferase [Methanobrevibacter sp. DSM 116169]|uniref:methylated-DNA--[protein]-cysteine S-methyltransferase n=1 Tax=Methanobrevibacter sp. DSM 116169 TaxID=3242727 RepID=UPI0038FCA0A5